MLSDEIFYQLSQGFPYTLSGDQEAALHTFADFFSSHDKLSVMILKGSAGTGKTSLAASIVQTLIRLKQNVTLLAPTGRAAKVFSLYAGQPAYTIHRFIYREKSYTGVAGEFNLNNNLYHNRFFLVDEASMISYTQGSNSFGSGSLLQDLIKYVYNDENCRLVLIGDDCQLPPVGEQRSAALRKDVLEVLGLTVFEANMTEVLRQSQNSGILMNAIRIRELLDYNHETQLPKIKLKGFADITVVPGDELIDTLGSSYSRVGMDETIVITRSNKRANRFNQGIRNMVLDREEELSRGDQVMIVRNKYLSPNKDDKDAPKIDFIANGDRAEIRRVRNIRELYGFRFADVILRFPDFNNFELETVVILDVLTSETPNLTQQQNEALFNAVMEDYQDIPQKANRIKQLKEDAYFNALQIKFGYAITCHKAQGGQWEHVYIDQGYMTQEMLNPDYIHTLYTAFTRATSHLYLINWPEEQIEEE